MEKKCQVFVYKFFIYLFTIFTAGCVTLEAGETPTLEGVCRRLDEESQIITLFAENYVPINCRSSLEGVFHFDYMVCMFYSNHVGAA